MPVTFGRRALTLLILALAAFLIASTFYDESRPLRPFKESEFAVPVPVQPQDPPREATRLTEHDSEYTPRVADRKEDRGPDVDEYMKDLLIWQRPENKDGHWPPYRDFIGRDYDPNRWEAFDEFVLQFSLSLLTIKGSEATISTPAVANSRSLIQPLNGSTHRTQTTSPPSTVIGITAISSLAWERGASRSTTAKTMPSRCTTPSPTDSRRPWSDPPRPSVSMPGCASTGSSATARTG